MIKKCKVILHNSAVTVVDYEGTKIQFPSIKHKTDAVYVKYVDGRCTITTKEDYEKSLKPKTDKKSKKVKATKTNTKEEVASSEVIGNE